MTTPTRTQIESARHVLRTWIVDGELEAHDLRDAGFVRGSVAPGRAEIAIPLRRDYGEVRQLRAQSVNLSTAGGYLRPANFEDAIEIALLFYDSFRPLATVSRVETGGPTHHPVADESAQFGSLLAENALIDSQDVTSFGDVTFRPQKFSSGFLLLPTEWLEDAANNLDLFLGQIIGMRIGRIQTKTWTNSVFVPQVPAGVTAASDSAISGDDLISLENAVDYSYRESPSAAWMMSQTIRQIISKLKDNYGRYLFRRSRKPGSPDTLMGKPIIINPNLPTTIASGTASVYFGAFDRIHIRDVRETRISRLVERYADYDQVGTGGLLRSDMALMDAGSHPIQSLVH